MQKAGFLFLEHVEVVPAKPSYQKRARTPEDLLVKLTSRGLVVDSGTERMALDYLRGVGAYRLKGYWHHLTDATTKRFVDGTTFSDVIRRCEFDRELRAATIAAIERLEVAIRCAIANLLSLKHSPHWFLQPSIFRPTREWGLGHLIRKIEEEVHRSSTRLPNTWVEDLEAIFLKYPSISPSELGFPATWRSEPGWS